MSDLTPTETLPEVLDLTGSFTHSARMRIGGIFVDMPYSRRCITCNSAERYLIETAYLRGWARRTVVRTVVPEESILWWPWPPDGRRDPESKLTEKQVMERVASHFKNGHSPIDTRLRIAVLERHAEAAGMDLDEVDGSIVTAAAIKEALMADAMELISVGALPMKASDVIRLITLDHIQQRDATGGMDADGLGLDAYRLAMRACFDVLGGIMTTDQQTQFYMEIQSKPEIMRILGAGQEQPALEAG